MTMLSLAAAYTVPGASFTISVAADGVATVQEDLVVDFDAPSHGIIREVPLNGASVDLVHCSEDCVVYEQGGVVCFQIGDADELVSGPVQSSRRTRSRNFCCLPFRSLSFIRT